MFGSSQYFAWVLRAWYAVCSRPKTTKGTLFARAVFGFAALTVFSSGWAEQAPYRKRPVDISCSLFYSQNGSSGYSANVDSFSFFPQ
jgi:hypothetical protein